MSLPTRTLGSNGLTVTALGLGCAPMSWLYGAAGSDDAASEAAILQAYELGVTLFDTADMYGAGHNEMLVGRALRGRRHEVAIATKFGYMRGLDGSDWGICGRPDYVARACTMSLRRLGIETIDLYYQHRVDPEVPIEETVGAMSRLVEEGKVRHLGLSEAGPETLRRAARVHPIAALQSEYSLWTRDPESAVLPVCRELGIGFVCFSPLGRGFLTGTVRHSPSGDATDFRRNVPRFEEENLRRNLALVDRLAEMAAARHCTAAQLALAWLLAQGRDIVPIPGTRNARHLQENFAAARIELSPAEAATVAAAIPPESIAGSRYNADLSRRVGI